MSYSVLIKTTNNKFTLCNFSSIEIPETDLHMQKYNELLYLLQDMETEITEKWLDTIPYTIKYNLGKKLFLIETERPLQLNFTDEVRAHKISIMPIN